MAQMENRLFGRKLARKSVLEINHVLHQARKHTERNNLEIGLMTSTLLEPGRLPKTDKLVISADAVIMVTQLQGQAQKLKELNLNLQGKIKELKDEKNELRSCFKLEKEKLEQQMKMLCAPPPGFLPAPPSIHPCCICCSKPSFDLQSGLHHQLPRCRYVAVHATCCCRYFTGPFASPSCCVSCSTDCGEMVKIYDTVHIMSFCSTSKVDLLDGHL